MSPTTDLFDEIADMFLSETDAPVVRRPRDGASAATELLMVGHLPVRGGLWLTPYADAIARQVGTTALVRLDGDEPMIQVLREERLADVAPTAGECRSLREAILHLGPGVRMWIVRPSARSTVADLAAAQADRITILSGADQAAVVNAYQLIKSLADEASRTGRAAPDLGLAVVGTGEESARRVAENLNRTTLSCLGSRVPLVLCLPRMDAGLRSSGLRSFPGQPRPALDEVMAWIGQSSKPRREARPDSFEPLGGRESELRPDDVHVRPDTPGLVEITRRVPPVRDAAPPPPVRDAVEPPPARVAVPPSPVAAVPPPTDYAASPPPVAAPHSPVGAASPPPVAAPHSPVGAASPSPVATPPAAASAGGPWPEPIETTTPSSTIRFAPAELEPKHPAPDREPHAGGRPVPLASYGARMVPGLEAIRPRCPSRERVELAVDPRGRLHLLAREDSLREMIAVDSWARAHIEIIQMACPQHTIAPTARTVHHVFTSEPARVADLHGTGTLLHVLTRVEVDGRQGWYWAPLNGP